MATDNRKATAKKVAAKIAETINNGLPSSNIHDSSSLNDYQPQSFNVENNQSIALENIAVPGLKTLTPELLTAMIPAFDSGLYRINDPLNPSDTIPQITQQQADRATTIYDGALRALQVTGKAFDVTKEKFTVIGKHAKTVNGGIQASTSIEQVKGNYLGYLNEVENTKQKNIELSVNQLKTVTTSRISVYSKDELQSQEKLAASKAEIMRLKDVELQSKLQEFKVSLGYIQSGN